MTAATMTRPSASKNVVRRLVRRLERERRNWSRGEADLFPTEQAWRAGIQEGLRLAQVAIRKSA
ncbi:hypothetical protein [Pseudonocardia sp. GCM10023141]|uniref:hypothetical protein n=1 Tax=Pseudonocardia sp. GCM10023141 TaxID=3252653 RepID=UPI003611B6B6